MLTHLFALALFAAPPLHTAGLIEDNQHPAIVKRKTKLDLGFSTLAVRDVSITTP